jgi:hypothetical protein
MESKQLEITNQLAEPTKNDGHSINYIPHQTSFFYTHLHEIINDSTPESFISEHKHFKKELLRSLSLRDGPKLKELTYVMKSAAASLKLQTLKIKCAELDLQLEQHFVIDKTLINDLLRSFDDAMRTCKLKVIKRKAN